MAVSGLRPGSPVVISPREVDSALGQILFAAEDAGRPVYTLPTSSALEELARAFDLPPEQGRRLLIKTAARQIGLANGGRRPFAELAETRWAPTSDRSAAPLGLATLVVLTLAAEGMHADSSHAANNYYARLHELLETPDARQKAVVDGYRRNAEVIWNRLNRWLEYWDGTRGAPTAYAVGQMRWIGLPLSQAVLRQADRETLHKVFIGEALPAGYRMPATELEVLLDNWMTRQPPVFARNVRTLWANPSVRDRIAEAASLELESWDGSGPADHQTNSARGGRALLLASLRTFPRASIDLSLALPGADDGGAEYLALTAGGGETPLDLEPGVAGRLQLADPSAADPASLLNNHIHISGPTSTYRRMPRRVVPFRFDELSMSFIEVETIQLGEKSLVLAAEDLAPKVDALLAGAARPGWVRAPASLGGLPTGWIAYSYVEVFRRGESNLSDLHPLLPRASVSVTITGGLALPGLLRKWSSVEPPEIHVVATEAHSIRLDILDGSGADEPIGTKHTNSSAAILDLGEFHLADGEYQVSVWLDEAKSPAATTLVRLRSGATPEIHRSTSLLVHRPASGPAWPFIASLPEGDDYVDGARIHIADVVGSARESADLPAYRDRPRKPKSLVTRRPFAIGTEPAADSCMRTGRHYIELPTAYGGRPETASVEGVCRGCGLIKRQPTTHWRAVQRRKRSERRPTALVDVGSLPPMHKASTKTPGITLDALCHVVNGSPGTLAIILGAKDNSALARWDYLRRLHVLGHVDLQRNPLTWDVDQWEITPSTLHELPGDVFILIGRRSLPELDYLAAVLNRSGGTLEYQEDQGVPRVLVGTRDVEGVVRDVGDQWKDLEVSPIGAAMKLAAALPSLSEVVETLPRSIVDGNGIVEMWDTESVSWCRVDRITGTGAFRVGHFARRYVVRNDQDVLDGTVRQATPELSKYIAALWSNDPLHGYHVASSSMIVPLGAELPGLYARSVCLTSGRLPVQLRKAPAVRYFGVPPEIASILHHKLMS